MNERRRLEHLLAQVADLLKKIQEYNKPLQDIPPEFINKLETLEQAFAIFEELNQRSLQEAHIDIEALRLKFQKSGEITPKDKRLVERAREIEKDAKRLQLTLSKALQRGRGQFKSDNPVKSRKERRKKFKPLGGDKGWIPL